MDQYIARNGTRIKLPAAVFVKRAQSLQIPTTVSIGVAATNDIMTGIGDLMTAADHAPYDAKRSGRNRVTCSAEVEKLTLDPSIPTIPSES